MESSPARSKVYYFTGALLLALGIILFTGVFTSESFGFSPAYLYTLTAFAIIVLAGVFYITQRCIRNGKHALLEYIVVAGLRYIVSVIMLGYALTKFRNGHMYLSYSMLDSRLNDLSSFDMVWSFYGRYSLFQAIIGMLELVPATLLLFRRTAFLGAALMFPVIANVALLNSFYPAGGFTFQLSFLVLIFTTYILYSFRDVIMELLAKASTAGARPGNLKPTGRKLIAVAKAFPLVCFVLLMITRVIAGRSHHPVKGAYELVQLISNGTLIDNDSLPPDAYRKIYFEKRRIQSSVINEEGPQGASIMLSGNDSIKIAYRNGPLDMLVAPDTTAAFAGTYRLTDSDGLILKGEQKGNAIEAHYEKIPLQEFDYWWE